MVKDTSPDVPTRMSSTRDAAPAAVVAKIPGRPVPLGRPRMTRSGRAYTPARSRAWIKAAALVIRSGFEGEALEGPVCLQLAAVYPRPKSWPRSAPSGRTWRPKRPDVDNVIKAACDALTASGVIVDDAQIVGIHAISVYAAKDESSHVQICLLYTSPSPRD